MRLLALILSTIMISLTSGAALAEEGQALCVGCLALPKEPLVAAAQKTRNTVLNPMAAQILYDRMEYLGIHTACRNFAGPKGYSQVGKYVMETLNPEEYPALFEGTDDIKRFCPAFSEFEDEDKKSFYVYILAHFSFAESTCRPNAKAPGLKPGDFAAGLFGNHLYREDYYTRPDYYRHKCKKGDSKNALTATRCTLGMLEGQFTSKKALITRRAHFEPLTGTSPNYLRNVPVMQPNGKRKKVDVKLRDFLTTAIKKYPLCK